MGALAALMVSAPAYAAGAREVSSKTLRVTIRTAEAQDCVTRPVHGRGVSRARVTAPAAGYVSARLRGPRGADWDLALLTGRRVENGSAALGSDELADSRVARGQRLTVQVCRRAGAGAAGRVKVRFFKAPQPAAKPAYAPKLVRVALLSGNDLARVRALRLDTTDHAAPTYVDVLLHSKAQESKLRNTGLSFSVRIGDVLARDRANRRREQSAGRSRSARAAASVGIPSGRTRYRTLPEIQEELKAVAAANPGLARTFTLPLRSLEGREIMGLEIAANVSAPADGRPEYMMVGTHHAREWPADEATMEWGLELLQGYKSGDPQLRSIVEGARTYLIPVLNVDGFNATIESEGLNPDGSYEDPVDSPGSSGVDVGTPTGAYKRKTCSDWSNKANEAIPCIARTFDAATLTPLPDYGVDPNRNYGVVWGGPGTSSDIGDQTYHGPAPFSEPETESFRRWLRDHQPAVLITNHTYTGLILRPPGTLDQAPVPDEFRLRALGDQMAADTSYLSQFSYQLYDTTGTTDDYIYGALGGFSYTPEIGKAEFHPAYTTGFIPEYDGRPATDRYGNPTGGKLTGLRGAFTAAGLAVLDPGNSGHLTGSAPAGRTLRIRKSVAYQTSARPDDSGVTFPVQTISEPRDTTIAIGANGAFAWTINPSTQPKRDEAAWSLTCEDGAGNVLESRSVFVARGQTVNLALSCAAGSGPSNPSLPRADCDLPDGFAGVDATRRSSGRLRIAFARRPGAGNATIEVFQTSKGRRVIRTTRIRRFTNRSGSFTWNGKTAKGRALSNGVYFVRYTAKDAAGRTDVRRVVVERSRGRFAKRASFYLADSCLPA